MLPAGTGPNALAWGTGHIAMPRVLRMFTADVAHLQPLQQLADAAGLFLPEAKTCAALQLLRL